MGFVAATTASVATTVTDVTLAVPAGGSNGDRLVVFLLRNNATATWSELTTTAFTSTGTPANAMAAFTRVVDGTEAGSYTFRSATNSANVGAGIMVRYSNVGTIAAISFTNQGSAGSIALASVAGVAGGILVGAVCRPVAGAATWTPPGTMTERHDALAPTSNPACAVADETLAASGATGTRTFTQTGTTNMKGMLVAFNPGSAVSVKVWDGAVEQPATVTVWNGSVELPTTVELAP